MTAAVDLDTARVLRTDLARKLAKAGASRPWTDAVASVPRHVFVPRFYRQDGTGEWHTVTSGDDGYLEGVYADRALTIQLTDGTPTSSSSEPGLMLAMLDALDVQAGQRVLEIGTGTGYNAALLAHRLGDANVTTVDVDMELTTSAAERFALAGYRPAVHTGDGADGVPSGAPYHHIIATCGMRNVPRPWIEQVAEGAVIVVPIGWGLARLTVRDDGAEGRFLTTGAYFMPRRTPTLRPAFATLDDAPPRRTKTALTEIDRLQFPLSLALPGYNSCTWNDQDGTPEAVGLWIPDGSAATVRADGMVREMGPQKLWQTVEEIHAIFQDSSPAREDFGVTVGPNRQRVWFQDPDGPGWDLPS